MKKLKNSKHYLVTKLNNKDKNIKNNLVKMKNKPGVNYYIVSLKTTLKP